MLYRIHGEICLMGPVDCQGSLLLIMSFYHCKVDSVTNLESNRQMIEEDSMRRLTNSIPTVSSLVLTFVSAFTELLGYSKLNLGCSKLDDFSGLLQEFEY